MIQSLSTGDQSDFAALPQNVRDEVRAWLKALAPLCKCPRGEATREMARIATTFGVSGKTVQRKWIAYRAHGDFRVLVNRAKCPSALAERELPPAFVEFWRGLCERNQRKCKPAYRELLRQWNRGERIPGYEKEPLGQPASDPRTGYPEGWSYRNLLEYKPTKAELAAARLGANAALKYMPQVRLTRVGLAVGQYYLFDDLWHDFKVGMLAQRNAQRLLQFHGLDLFSACLFVHGTKPVLEDEMTQVEERLREREMLFLVACVLGRDGYRTDGRKTTLVVENRTATLPEAFVQRIADLTNGQVVVEFSGMRGGAAFAGQHDSRHGMPGYKAALESLGNLIHNETANVLEFPGQTGSNSRLNAPEELAGREAYHRTLSNVAAAVGPERARSLKFPFIPLDQANALVNQVIEERINQRIEHRLEGWREAGLVTQEFRLGLEGAVAQTWLPMTSLAGIEPAQRNAIAALVQQACYSRTRLLSPREVFERGRGELTRLPAYLVPDLLGRELARERSVRAQLFEFEAREHGPGVHRYLAKVRNRFGGEEMLRDGETYLTHVNPLDLAELHVCNSRGGYLGTCSRWDSVSRADADALHRQIGRAKKVQAEILAPVARRGAGIMRERLADIRQNIAVAGGRAITDEEKSRQRALAADARTLTQEDRAAVLSHEENRVNDEQEFADAAKDFSRYFATTPATADQ